MPRHNDIVITIPKTVSEDIWKGIMRKNQDQGIPIYTPIPSHLKCKPGDRCYIVHDGRVVGYTAILGANHLPYGAKNPFTGEKSNKGLHVKRSSIFREIQPIRMSGFKHAKVFRIPRNDIQSPGKQKKGGNFTRSELLHCFDCPGDRFHKTQDNKFQCHRYCFTTVLKENIAPVEICHFAKQHEKKYAKV